MYKTTEQKNSNDINILLMSEEYYREMNFEGEELDFGKNLFIPELLKSFTHIDTYVKDNGDVRLQGWLKPIKEMSLPECEVWGFNPEYGIMIGSLTIKK